MPVASARSFLGNHSAIALIEAGKLPDSPRPSEKRAAENRRFFSRRQGNKSVLRIVSARNPDHNAGEQPGSPASRLDTLLRASIDFSGS